MKTKTIILLLLIWANSFSQNEKIFEIKTVFKTKAEILELMKNNDSLRKKEFYENEKYIVYRFCQGEWGGAIIFKNKLTNKKFICRSTCPVMVTKFNNKYFVTNTLHHLSSSTEILEIVNPEKLQKATEEDERRLVYEKVPQIGAKKLISIYGYSTLYTFVYSEKLYHIVSGKEGIFIAEILNGKFNKLQTIFSENLWSNSPKILSGKDYTILSFNSYTDIGYIEIKEDMISICTVK